MLPIVTPLQANPPGNDSSTSLLVDGPTESSPVVFECPGDETYYSDASSTQTLASEDYELDEENGRGFPRGRRGTRHPYPLPVDPEAQMIERRWHEMLKSLTEKIHHAPVPPFGNAIDLGTGVGAWAKDLADAHPNINVYGIDIAPIQPSNVSDNLYYQMDDIEFPFQFQRRFHLVHARGIELAIHDWPLFLTRCFRDLLEPNGFIELEGTVPEPISDHFSIPVHPKVQSFCQSLVEASWQCGTPWDAPKRFAQMLEEAGFVDIQTNCYKVPLSDWPTDEKMKSIGREARFLLARSASGFGVRLLGDSNRTWAELGMMGFRMGLGEEMPRQYFLQ
jgi:trans-aconitate methyltransferase